MDMSDTTIQGQILGQLVRLHVDKALENAGIKRGDIIRCGAAEWEW